MTTAFAAIWRRSTPPAQADAGPGRRGRTGELVEAAIERIERLNPTLNAVVTPIFERASEAGRGRDG